MLLPPLELTLRRMKKKFSPVRSESIFSSRTHEGRGVVVAAATKWPRTQFPLLSLLHPPPPRGEGAAEASSGKRETATAAATTNRETTESFMVDLSRKGVLKQTEDLAKETRRHLYPGMRPAGSQAWGIPRKSWPVWRHRRNHICK